MSLKVFNLQCDAGHLFEGWFGSHDDYDSQQARGLITCPICQSAHVQKMPSAPRINSSKTVAPSTVESADTPAPVAQGPSELAKLQAAFLMQMRQVVGRAEDVGATFASEARAIHEGEADARPIRGIATPEEREALAEDGIDFVVLPDFLSDDRLQ